MFFGKKNRQEHNKKEFVAMLARMAGISEQKAADYYVKNEGFIIQSYSRGLDTFGTIWHIANASMERICAAHEIDELDLIEDIPDFMLLVSLQVANHMAEVASDEELNANNAYWNAVIKLEMNRDNSGRTYGDRLHELVAEYKARKS